MGKLVIVVNKEAGERINPHRSQAQYTDPIGSLEKLKITN
jgi:hypothetical protein